MGIVPDELLMPKGGYIKAEEFKKGKALEVVSFGVITANDKDYGANDKDYLFTEGKLKEGETFKYVFKEVQLDEDDDDFNFDEERVLESKSVAFFIPFSELNPEKGDKLWIKRTGEGKKTRYSVDIYTGQDGDETEVVPEEEA